MTKKGMGPSSGRSSHSVLRFALTSAILTLLIAGGPTAAEQPASDVDQGCYPGQALSRHGAWPSGIEGPVDKTTGVAFYWNTRYVDLLLDIMESTAPSPFEVQQVGSTWRGKEIRAVHVRVPAVQSQRPDDAELPSLLVECNMHGREWLAMESCASFLWHLLAAYLEDPAQVLGLIQQVQLYVIPVANPDGRNFDDNFFPLGYWWSSPLHHHNSQWFHEKDVYGWRTNRQPVVCLPHAFGLNLGIDLARNFSCRWKQASSDCLSLGYRGRYPFQAPEAAALRRFVNNRTVSMSLHVHSAASRFEVPSEGIAEAGDMRDGFIHRWNKALDTVPAERYPYVELTNQQVSGWGVGQFSGWMIGKSNNKTEGEKDLDHGTRRRINAFLLELPPPCDTKDQCSLPYQGSPYDNGGNLFHPSAPAIIKDVVPAFIEALEFFVAQAQFPWCAIDRNTLEPGSCVDVGLTGSKIAAATHDIGILGWRDTGTECYEAALAGSYGAVYRIQNFDTGSPVSVDVEVEVASKTFTGETYFVDHTFTTTHNLAPGGSDVGEVADSLFTYTGARDYRVKIRILNALPDNEPMNDLHVFKFRVFSIP